MSKAKVPRGPYSVIDGRIVGKSGWIAMGPGFHREFLRNDDGKACALEACGDYNTAHEAGYRAALKASARKGKRG